MGAGAGAVWVHACSLVMVIVVAAAGGASLLPIHVMMSLGVNGSEAALLLALTPPPLPPPPQADRVGAPGGGLRGHHAGHHALPQREEPDGGRQVSAWCVERAREGGSGAAAALRCAVLHHLASTCVLLMLNRKEGRMGGGCYGACLPVLRLSFCSTIRHCCLVCCAAPPPPPPPPQPPLITRPPTCLPARCSHCRHAPPGMATAATA